jgi:hypothetical protein
MQLHPLQCTMSCISTRSGFIELGEIRNTTWRTMSKGHVRVKSKNFIENVMFLAVITRPRFDSEGNCIFDGKIGIFAFTYVEPAKRKSRNRPRCIISLENMFTLIHASYFQFEEFYFSCFL